MRPIVLPGEAQFSDRIYDDFCQSCKFKQYADTHSCSHFVSSSAVCVRFVFRTEKLRKDYEDQVLHNQATTIWLEKGRTLEEIWQMPDDKLLSVLTPAHYNQFEQRRKEDAEELERITKLAELSPEELQEALHKKAKKEKAKKEQKQPHAQKNQKKEPIPKPKNVVLESARVPVSSKVRTPTIKTVPKQDVFPSLPDTAKRPQQHFFYCEDQLHRKITYRRSTQAVSYESEVKAFRKYLAKKGITILSEEIK